MHCRSQVRLIDAIVHQEQKLEPVATEARSTALAQVLEAQAGRIGPKRGVDFVLGQRSEDQIVFLTRDRLGDIPAPIPLASDMAEPMRLALRASSDR